MEAYEGREPYIFISYARVDADKVAPLLEALSSAGYRIWWDKGIEAGADWLKKLFAKVEGCAIFCPLFSKASLDSPYCFVEAAWAYQNEKNIVPFYLEALKEESFRRLYQLLQKYQGLPLYKYADAAEFVDGLGGQPAFTSCKAPEWNKIGQIQWRFTESDGVLTIAKNEDMKWHLGSIPPYQHDMIYGNTAPWKSYRKKIFSVVIERHINAIGDNAFWGCYALTDVRISDSVTRIGDYAFWWCENLKNLRIPDYVTEIGDYAFAFCKNLTDVRIPDGVTKIGDYAFSQCKSLMSVSIPRHVTVIGHCVFSGCLNLTDVRFPGGVTEIGNESFGYCFRLTDVRISDSVTRIGDAAFISCKNLTNVRIPDSVSEIGDYAFYGCESLKSVEIRAGAGFYENTFPPHTRVIRRAAPEQLQ